MTSQTQTETVALDPTTVTTNNVTVCEPHDNSDWDTNITPDLRLLVPDRRPSESRCPAKRGLDGANDGGTQSQSVAGSASMTAPLTLAKTTKEHRGDRQALSPSLSQIGRHLSHARARI